LSRENFYKMKARLAEKRLLTMKGPADMAEAEGEDDEAGMLVKELRKRCEKCH